MLYFWPRMRPGNNLSFYSSCFQYSEPDVILMKSSAKRSQNVAAGACNLLIAPFSQSSRYPKLMRLREVMFEICKTIWKQKSNNEL